MEPNFALSGKLAEEANTVRGVVLVHGEPPEARKPGLRWRLYTFKNGARLCIDTEYGPVTALYTKVHRCLCQKNLKPTRFLA